MTRRTASGLLAMGVLAGLACGKSGGPAIATLIENGGVVEKTIAEAPWRAVATGAGFALGDAARTGPGSFARLGFAAGGTIRLGERSLVRFRAGAPESADHAQPEISVDLGRAEIVDAGELFVSSLGSRVRVDRGTRVRIDADGDKVNLEVIVGRAVVSGDAGAIVVAAGHGISLRIGGAIIERYDVEVGRATLERLAKEPAPAAADPVVVVAPGDVPVSSVGVKSRVAAAGEPARADVTFTAGDSAVIHNDKGPLAVRLRFDGICPGEARVELGKRLGIAQSRGRLSGSGSVVLRLRAGRTPYRVRCVGDGPANATEGVLSLKRDSGNAPLARQAPSNTIEADGRRYTVLFQSRPPVMTLAWSAPSGASELDLHIDSDGQTRTLRASGSSYRLPSGALREGTHTWWFTTKDGRTSPRTTLTIHFDNTAPTAQFFRGAVAGGSDGAIPIDGVVVQGAKVSAAGQPLTVDDRGRFRAAVMPLDGDVAVAVHVESPHGGSHYYIRRKQGTP